MTTVSTATIVVQDELARLKKEKEQSLLRARKLAQDHDLEWTKEISYLAQILEQEHILLKTEFLIAEIATEIARIYRDAGIPVWNNVARYVPQRFRNEEKITVLSSVRLQSGDRNQLVESFITKFKELFREIPNIPRDDLAECHDIVKHSQTEMEHRSKVEKIALFPKDNDSQTDQINSSKEGDREHVTIDRPKPHGSLTHEAIGRAITQLTKVQERVFQFPPEVLANDQQIADAWDTWCTWMDPSLDLKYSKNWMDWFKAEKYRDIFGKHAAGVLSFSVTNLCANCSEEKNKIWVRMEPVYAHTSSTFECLQCGHSVQTICPKCQLSLKEVQKPIVSWQCPECESTTPMTRNLTREQIGDKSSIIVDAAMDVLDRIPSQMAFCDWYRDWIDPRVAGRKIRLSGDLSEMA